MKKWSVEMSYGVGFTVTGIEAETKNQAIETAKEIIEDDVSIVCGSHIDCSDLEFEQTTFVTDK